MAGSSSRIISPLVPSNPYILIALVILTSVVDSVCLGYDGSLMGSLNVLPYYKSYFTLTTTTTGLNSAITYVGGACTALFAGKYADKRGRREGIVVSALIQLLGGALQGAAQNIAMFIVGRFFIGCGAGIAAVAAPTYVAETTPVKYRAFALGLYYTCWAVGTLIAAGVCFGTKDIASTWSWRIPSLLQIVPSLVCILIISFLPESPRWLAYQDRIEECRAVLERITPGSDECRQGLVDVQLQEIVGVIEYEKGAGKQLSFVETLRGAANRKRVLLTCSFSVIVMLTGSNIITFYFGTMLSQAGITDNTTQLEINIILSAWSLIVGFVGSLYADRLGRRLLAMLSVGGAAICFYLVGGLTAAYGESTNKSGIYATIACIFLFNGAYGFGVTPLTVLYPPEILSYSIRASGMAMYTFTTKLCGLFVTFVFPFALDAITWKTYIINASFDVLCVIFIWWCWIETKGLSLEQVDQVVEYKTNSEVGAKVAEIMNGEEPTQIALVCTSQGKPGVGEKV